MRREKPPRSATREDARASAEVRKVAARAVRRLDLLEWVILAVAAGLATVAGALAAFVLEAWLGLPFRPTWTVASVVLFVVPALGAWLRARQPREREVGTSRNREPGEEGQRHGG